MFHGVFRFFVKGLEKTGLFIVDSVLYTILSSFFCLVFIRIFSNPINGYFIGYTLAEFLCILFLFFYCKLYKYIRFQKINKKLLKIMIAYSIPLIIDNICWWVMNMSDKYVVLYKLGAYSNGLLTIVHKIPSICTMIFFVLDILYKLCYTNYLEKYSLGEFYVRN